MRKPIQGAILRSIKHVSILHPYSMHVKRNRDATVESRSNSAPNPVRIVGAPLTTLVSMRPHKVGGESAKLAYARAHSLIPMVRHPPDQGLPGS